MIPHVMARTNKSPSLCSVVYASRRGFRRQPLRPIQKLADQALPELSPVFTKLYAREGRPSIPPERLSRVPLLQAFYTMRSEPLLIEGFWYNLLSRRFVGLSMDDVVWDATVSRKNPDRLANRDITRKFMTGVLNLPQVRGLLSREHFPVNVTLIEAWTSMKSVVPKDGNDALPSGGGAGRDGRNAERDLRGEKRANNTHFSTTDADARLFRNGAGKEARLCDTKGTAERAAALDMIDNNAKAGSTAGANTNEDISDVVAGCRERGCTPRVAQNNTNRRSAIDAWTTRQPGYRISMIKRKRAEEPFGRFKTVGGFRKTGHRGRDLIECFFVLTAIAYNLIPIPTISVAAECLMSGPPIATSPEQALPAGRPQSDGGLSERQETVEAVAAELNGSTNR
jgi:transposase